MLHAVNAKKSKLTSFYKDGERRSLEDLVTSSVFGPLEFMPAHDRAWALKALFEGLGLSPPGATPELEFWPKRTDGVEHGFRERFVEPDLLIRDGEAPRWIVEVKWGAALSDNELAAQWASLSPAERSGCGHLLLVRDAAGYRERIDEERRALDAQRLTPWPIEIREWRWAADTLRALTVAPATPAHVASWALHTAQLLVREEIRTMRGWRNLALRSPGLVDWSFGVRVRLGQLGPSPSALAWRFERL